MKDIEKRDVRITCRITKSAEAMINFYEGESFSDKICNMAKTMQDMTRHGILEDRLKLMDEIKQLDETMTLMNKAYNNMLEMNRRYTEELLEKDRKIINMNVRDNGFLPNDNIINNMLKLNQLTGRENTVKDVYDLYTTKDYGTDDIKECVELLAEEFKKQELETAIETVNIEG